jgi:hypothetical protein
MKNCDNCKKLLEATKLSVIIIAETAKQFNIKNKVINSWAFKKIIKTINDVEGKKIIFAFLFLNCGGSIEGDLYQSDLITKLEKDVGAYFEVELMPLTYVVTETEGPCKKDVPGCISAKDAIVYFDPGFENDCRVIAHELTHAALFLKTGDSDSDHKHFVFVRITKTFCEGL